MRLRLAPLELVHDLVGHVMDLRIRFGVAVVPRTLELGPRVTPLAVLVDDG